MSHVDFRLLCVFSSTKTKAVVSDSPSSTSGKDRKRYFEICKEFKFANRNETRRTLTMHNENLIVMAIRTSSGTDSEILRFVVVGGGECKIRIMDRVLENCVNIAQTIDVNQTEKTKIILNEILEHHRNQDNDLLIKSFKTIESIQKLRMEHFHKNVLSKESDINDLHNMADSLGDFDDDFAPTASKKEKRKKQKKKKKMTEKTPILDPSYGHSHGVGNEGSIIGVAEDSSSSTGGNRKRKSIMLLFCIVLTLLCIVVTIVVVIVIVLAATKHRTPKRGGYPQ